MNYLNEKKRFFRSFNFENLGFIDFVELKDAELGFTIRKIFNDDSSKVTSISLYIPDSILDNTEVELKPIVINVYYGERTLHGLKLRMNPKLNEPIDLLSAKEYYYNIHTGQFFKKGKKISADEILSEIYGQHIKSTKILRGLYVRMKFWLIRTTLARLFEYVSLGMSFFLEIISDDIYRYGFTELVMDKYKVKREIDKTKLDERKGDRLVFSGYEASRRCVAVYAGFHFFVFTIFYLLGYKPEYLLVIFKNNFLTLIYIIFSFIILDKWLPWVLKNIIKRSYQLSNYFSYMEIKI